MQFNLHQFTFQKKKKNFNYVFVYNPSLPQAVKPTKKSTCWSHMKN